MVLPRPHGRRRSPPLAAALVAATIVLAGACGGDSSGGSGGSGGSGSSTASGAELYEKSCALCHGFDLRGTRMGPSHLSQVYEPGHHSDEAFRSAITRGTRAHHWNFGDMAPVAGLDDDEIDAIIAFIREQQELHGFEPYPPN